ncbi:hypothetical protein ASPVEDRAFT_40759 [Aspergillus versicolor CBS 583.65]|uniref:Uncharacterized protein n=1 Tax=Aspergillus versicolor CBS 583.65 TaxID=1036611 RepID=A0A1L9PID0_ASPVE|nr:uncharacterized protein ASPVEDRAFT_40759 [Aspergillus versicolor CBS 583.65]OJJ01206.1 hypothetical protein ASPVEDRAFT_40759 [Aspergillus versicolor CBS 583.65]
MLRNLTAHSPITNHKKNLIRGRGQETQWLAGKTYCRYRRVSWLPESPLLLSGLPETSAAVLPLTCFGLALRLLEGLLRACRSPCSSKNLDQRITGKERNECGHQNEYLPRHFSSFGLPRTFFRPWTEEGRSQVWFVPVSGALEANHTVCSNATHLICMHSKREHGLSQTFETFFLSWRSAGP